MLTETKSAPADHARPVIAAVQSCYIPWKGFFDIIRRVDHFVVYDDVQFVKRHWHNRNRIRTANGTVWLTIPVNTKGKYLQRIDETTVSEKWAEKHWRALTLAYRRAPFFSEYESQFQAAYAHVDQMDRLTDINVHFLQTIAQILGLGAKFSLSSEYQVEGHKTDRLLSLCKALGAGGYVSGPSAKTYFEEQKFEAAGIQVDWMDYSGYRPYPQLHDEEFDHAVSILDLIFNVGPQANDYMKASPGWKRSA